MGEQGANYANSWYTWARAKMPEGVVAEVETKVAELATPVLKTVPQVLSAVDDRVDRAMSTAESAVEKAKGQASVYVDPHRYFSADQLTTFKQARETYLARVEEAVTFVKKEGVQGAAAVTAELLTKLVADARNVDTNAIVTVVSDVWGKFAAMPAVEQALAGLAPRVEGARAKYAEVHDKLVTDKRYAAALQQASENVSYLMNTPVYQKVAEWLSWAVQKGGMEPFLASTYSAASPYVEATLAHLQPVETK